jgi:hypothetical protein
MPAAGHVRKTGSIMNTTTVKYRMDPAEDEIRFGDELAEDMWVLAEDWLFRSPHGDSEEDKIRAQRFRRVTRIRRSNGIVQFVGEWIDGYQEVHSYSESYAWLVKKKTS